MVSKNKHNILGISLEIKKIKKILLSIITHATFLYYSSNITT